MKFWLIALFDYDDYFDEYDNYDDYVEYNNYDHDGCDYYPGRFHSS